VDEPARREDVDEPARREDIEWRRIMFADRADAGEQLAERLLHLRDEDVIVLGLPRGGVPVAFEVARALGAPLDVIVVRKLGVPRQPELGMGAIGEDGARIINRDVLSAAGATEGDLAAVEQRERVELERRARRYRGDHPRIPLTGRTVIVVDDGIATGSTARAACHVARAHGATHVVLAVPIAPRDWYHRIGDDADELVCVETVRAFFAIGQFYDDFSQTSDAEVVSCLQHQPSPPADAPITSRGDRDGDHATDDRTWRDPSLEHAREEADGIELYEDPFGDEAVLVEREEAQGVEVFDLPEAAIPATALREGSPGHESYGGGQVGLDTEADDERQEQGDEELYET
jgi:predicted phosphoribosyltransferase